MRKGLEYLLGGIVISIPLVLGGCSKDKAKKVEAPSNYSTTQKNLDTVCYSCNFTPTPESIREKEAEKFREKVIEYKGKQRIINGLSEVINKYPGTSACRFAEFDRANLLENGRKKIEAYESIMKKYPEFAENNKGTIMLQIAGTYEMMNDKNNAIETYKQVANYSDETQQKAKEIAIYRLSKLKN